MIWKNNGCDDIILVGMMKYVRFSNITEEETHTLEGYEDSIRRFLILNDVMVEEASLYNIVLLGNRIHISKQNE